MKYKLGDICFIQSGGTPSRSNKKFYSSSFIPWVKVGDLNQKDEFTQTDESISEEGLNSIGNRVFERGTLLLAMYGSVGKTAIAGAQLSSNQAVLGIDSKDKNVLDNQYLKYWFDFHRAQLIFKSKGGTLKNLNLKYVNNLIIELPSIREQNRVITLFKTIEDLIRNRERTIQLLEEYLETIFVKMFGDSYTNQFDWNMDNLKNVTKLISDGTQKTPKYVDKGVVFLSAKNIKENTIDWSNTKYISSNEYEELLSRGLPEKGDILLTKSGSLGRSAILEKTIPFSFYESVALIKCNFDKLNPYFLVSLLRSEAIQFILNDRKKGVAVKHLHLNMLRELEIILPPIQIQNRYEAIYKQIGELSNRMSKSQSYLKELFQSSIYNVFAPENEIEYDEINRLINDDIQLEIFLNTINASDFDNEEQYNIAIEKLYKILDTTKIKNLSEPNNLKGILQRLEDDSIILETNKEYKYRLRDETITD